MSLHCDECHERLMTYEEAVAVAAVKAAKQALDRALANLAALEDAVWHFVHDQSDDGTHQTMLAIEGACLAAERRR